MPPKGGHHSEVTVQRISQARRRVARQNADALPLQESKKCTHPDCPCGNKPQPISNFSLKTRRWQDGHVVKYPHSWCRACANRVKREKRAEADKEKLREQERVWRQAHKERDPEALREYQRIWSSGKRRERGVPERQFKYRPAIDDGPDPELELTEEFQEFLRNLPHGTQEQVEYRMGQKSGYLSPYASGGRSKIKLSVADRILHAAGNDMQLTDFWPHV